ncbi:MAG: LysM peptidoglycan-binding domain-containing protein [Leptothrix sp. (in: b-proteobacteria)]
MIERHALPVDPQAHPAEARSPHATPRRSTASAWGAACVLVGLAALGTAAFGAGDYPVSNAQRSVAQQVAQAGVPLSELAPDAPDSHTVVAGDTLWDISKLFLRSPWRWPELWGMNLDQIRNPHLIYPGQHLMLVKSEGRARLQLGRDVGGAGTQKLLARVRSSAVTKGAIGPVSLQMIQPFLNEAVVLNSDELARAPRIVAGQEGRVLMAHGDIAYVRGELAPRRDWKVFRQALPLTDPVSGEVLGYEAAYVGSAEYLALGREGANADGEAETTAATFSLSNLRLEANVGDRLAAAPPRDDLQYTPHAPAQAIDGRVVSVYGGGSLQAGQNQVISFNQGRDQGVEPGHVLAIWRAGSLVRDAEDKQQPLVRLPDERNGLLFVFRVFDRVSYGLVLSSQGPVVRGDRLAQP